MSLQPPAPSDPTVLIAPTGLISAAAPIPGEAPASPPPTSRTLPGLLLVGLVLFGTYGGLFGILLPLQVAIIDEAAKVENFAFVSTLSFVFTLFAQPLIGAISDRTRSRLGRRAPWMIAGALVGGLGLLAMGSLTSILMVALFWVVIQVALNAVQGPYSAIIPDRFQRSKRGGASAMVGIGTQIGGTLGVMVAGLFAENLGLGYGVFGVAVIVVTVVFVLIDRDWSSKLAAVEPWSWKRFFGGFWINPKAHPDFAWAFAARFLLMLGYMVVVVMSFYILTDYIGMSLGEATEATVMLTVVSFLPTLLAIALSGWWSDKIGRRKVFIYAGSIVMVAGLVVPLFMPDMTGMIIMNIVNGIGFGLYMAVDAALMTEVLPGGGTNAAKDLGILNIATNVPQAMSGAIAGIIILQLGGYAMLFVFSIVFTILAALATVPIKSVR